MPNPMQSKQPQPGRTRRRLESVSHRITRRIAMHWGETLPLYCICEFPRSGGTWLASMTADYFRCAKIGRTVLPIAARAVIHNHWRYHPKIRRVVYLHRDGRDVMVSWYFYAIRQAKIAAEGGNPAPLAGLTKILGESFDADDPKANLPRFLEHAFRNAPGGTYGMNWAQHVADWHDPERRPHILYVSYEDLRREPVEALRRVVEHLGQGQAETRLLERSVSHFDMQAMTGRQPGQESTSDFIRKGIVGDWRNYFNQEACKIFQNHAQTLLQNLSYEKDDRWTV